MAIAAKVAFGVFFKKKGLLVLVIGLRRHLLEGHRLVLGLSLLLLGGHRGLYPDSDMGVDGLYTMGMIESPQSTCICNEEILIQFSYP
jgi:hypothetical protein